MALRIVRRVVFAVAMIVACAGRVSAQVHLDAVATAVDTASVTTKDLTTLTVGTGTNRALVLQITWTGVPTAISVKWDPATTNQTVTQITLASTTTNSQTVALYGLVAPTSGNKTLRASWTGSQEVMMQAVSWTGVDQTGGATSFPHGTSAAGNNASPTVNITSATNNMAMSVVAAGTAQSVTAVSVTQTFLTHGIGSLEGGGSWTYGATTVTATGTLSGTDRWVITGTDILAAPIVAGVDNFVDMNTATTSGTTLTPTIMNNGTQGFSSLNWTMSPSTPTGLTITTHGIDRLVPTVVRGVGTFAANSTTRRIALDDSKTLTYAIAAIPLPQGFKTSVGMWITLGPTNISPSGNVWDLIRLENGLGHYSILQLNSGAGAGGKGYSVDVETDPGSVTTVTGTTTLTQGATYWFSLWVDFGTTFTTQLDIFDTSGTSVASVSGSVDTTGGSSAVMNLIKLGQSQNGTDASTTTFFQDILIDYITAVKPLGPNATGGGATCTPTLGSLGVSQCGDAVAQR